MKTKKTDNDKTLECAALSLTRHAVVGAELKQVHNFLVRLQAELNKTYGTTSRSGKFAGQALERIDRLRQNLDSQALDDHPLEWMPDLYYGIEAWREGSDHGP